MHWPTPAQSAGTVHVGPVSSLQYLLMSSAIPMHFEGEVQSASMVQGLTQAWRPLITIQSYAGSWPPAVQSALTTHCGGVQAPLSQVGLVGYMLPGQLGMFGGQQSAGIAQPFLQWPAAPPLELLVDEELELELVLVLDAVPEVALLEELELDALSLAEELALPPPLPPLWPHPSVAAEATPSKAARIRTPER
jgi:hypothetical protein